MHNLCLSKIRKYYVFYLSIMNYIEKYTFVCYSSPHKNSQKSSDDCWINLQKGQSPESSHTSVKGEKGSQFSSPPEIPYVWAPNFIYICNFYNFIHICNFTAFCELDKFAEEVEFCVRSSFISWRASAEGWGLLSSVGRARNKLMLAEIFPLFCEKFKTIVWSVSSHVFGPWWASGSVLSSGFLEVKGIAGGS